MKNSLVSLVKLLLVNNNIFFDKKELDFQIHSHPSYPSLHAVTGVLDHFNIDNIAAEVPKNLETLLELPNCFIAQIKKNKGKELVTVVRKELDYFLFYSSRVKEKHTANTFLEKFTGIIVGVESNKTIEEKQTFNYVNILLIGFLLISVMGVFLISKPSILKLIFFFTSLVGLFISISIYKQELGINSKIGNAFCGTSNKKKDCEAVLSSKGATVFKDYKLSDFSLLYFLGLTLATFLLIIKNTSLDVLYIINIIILPITFYSIYYQFKVVKKWCFLCLSIIGVLWFQAAFVFFDNSLNKTFNFQSLFLIAFSFSTVIFGWSFLKPKFKEFQENNKIKIEAYKFKRNYKLFSNLLKSSKKIDTQLNDVSEIIFGNKKSKLEILIITNPFCGHCKPVHEMVENILKKYENELKIVVRFNINSKEKENDVIKITSRLLELYQKDGISICLTAMNQIYKGESVANWLKKWGKCSEKEKYTNVLEKENIWCKENDINFTPEILVNGHSFPKEYDRADLMYFIEDLKEQCFFASTERNKYSV